MDNFTWADPFKFFLLFPFRFWLKKNIWGKPVECVEIMMVMNWTNLWLKVRS